MAGNPGTHVSYRGMGVRGWVLALALVALVDFASPLLAPGVPLHPPGRVHRGGFPPQDFYRPPPNLVASRSLAASGGRGGALGLRASTTPVEGLDGIDDLIRSGAVRVWRRDEAPEVALTGGARGAGHNKTSSRQHREPTEIYVIGTSHVSKQSAADVKRLIEAVQPDNVVVELCRSRAGIMYASSAEEDEEKQQDKERAGMLSLNGPSFLQASVRSLSLGGGTAFLLRAMLAGSPQLSALTGQVGVDFRAARSAGEKGGAQIVLGDRPVEITLERCWRAMSREEKWRAAKLLGNTMFSKGNSTELRMQMGEMADKVDAYEAQLAELLPSVVDPLIRERDVFLSLTMKSSMAVNGCQRVVGVVGLGHLEGVMACLDQDHSGRFKELTWTPSRAAIKQKVFGVPRAVVERLAWDTVLFGGLYLLYLAFWPQG